MEVLFEQIRSELPLLVSRREAARIGRWSVGTLANKDSAGSGPPRVVVAGRVRYPRESFIAWLAAQINTGHPETVARCAE